MTCTVAMSEMKVSSRPGDILIAYSIGSSIGLSLFDPEAHVGGLIHCMLPSSHVDPDRARQNPCMFTDTGVAELIQAVVDSGADRKRLIAKAAGAATPLDDKGMLRIGKRNHDILRDVLSQNGIVIAAESVGGTGSRTMSLYMNTGRTTIRSRGREEEL